MKPMHIFLFIFLLSICSSQILERYHPELKWKKFKTEHFDIIFHEGTERSAKRLAEIAEDIYIPVTTAYNWVPKKRISWIVKDIDDYSNGGAYFLDHKIEIWTEHLDFDLRGTHDWLRNVVTHEFIHMIHIQKSFSSSLNIPFVLMQWIGYERERRKDVVRGFPNILFNYPQMLFRVPAWLAEGVAQHQLNKARYDYRDAHREMVLRDRFLNGKVLSLEEMSTFGKTTIGNESSYNQGFSLVNYITKRFGENVLAKISEENANWSALYNYNDVFKRATGVGLETLYNDWKKERTSFYQKNTESIQKNVTQAKFIQEKGEANFYPKFSSNGKCIAYLSSEGSRRFSKNKLVVYDRKTKSKKIVTSNVSSHISWFPDNSKILYSKQTEPDKWGSHYNDLYYYDLTTEEEVRITKNCRARNPVINSENEIVFITAYDGTTNFVSFKLSSKKQHFILDQQNQKILSEESKSERFGLRNAWVTGENVRYLTSFNDGTQLFHPVFKNDTTIVTDISNGYQRRIDSFNLGTRKQSTLISGNGDYRNPTYSNNILYFSSEASGIFNLYKESIDKPITNVLGGAFMPHIEGDSIVYSEYINGGYKIALNGIHEIDVSKLTYNVESFSTVPNIKEPKTTFDNIKLERVGYNFNSYYLVPRIFVDDKYPKFGAVFIVNELLNKATALLGASYNKNGERDIFGLLEFRNFTLFGTDPIFFVEGYNQTTKVEDRIYRKFGEFQFESADRDVEFSLWQYETGFKLKLKNGIDWRLAYINSRYHASLSPAVSEPLLNGGKTFHISYPFIRYNYHLGNSIETRFLLEQKDPSFTGSISPRKGFRFYTRWTYNKNRFLDGFSTNTGFLLEKYKNYNYLNGYFKGSYNLPGLFKYDSFTLNASIEGNFSKTDEFYDVYSGGWIGLKGYPYFSMHGRHLGLFSTSYTSLLGSDLNFNAGLLRIKNVAFSLFGELGDAWTDGDISLKKDVGFQIKADAYGPLKLLIEGAYPIDEIDGKQRNSEGDFESIRYAKDWRFYFMISYDFGLLDIL